MSPSVLPASENWPTHDYWYNYDTEEYEYRACPTTPDQMLPYLPKGPSRNLFLLYIRPDFKNMPMLEAAVHVLKLSAGLPVEEIA